MPENTITELVKEFARYVVAQHQAVAQGDAQSGNRYAKRYIAAFERLRLHGDSGRDALAALLSDRRAEVRVMSAAFLLRHCPDRARTILEAEAKGEGMVAFGAGQALQRWDEGTWRLDLV